MRIYETCTLRIGVSERNEFGHLEPVVGYVYAETATGYQIRIDDELRAFLAIPKADPLLSPKE